MAEMRSATAQHGCSRHSMLQIDTNEGVTVIQKKIRIKFIESLLGTASSDPEIHSHYIASKSEDAQKIEEEVAAIGVDEAIERGKTIFARMEDGTPHLWDYQIKGFFKDACGMLRRVPGTKSVKLKAYKKEIDGLIFVFPRKIPLWLPEELDLSETDCQRPLRASTPQGERVALAHSEEVPAGTYTEATIMCLRDDQWPLVKEWLDYGILRGIGQWRNSGKGRMVWEELDNNGNVVGGNADSVVC